MKIINELTFDRHLFERFNRILSFEGLDVYDAEHAIERFDQRFPEFSLDKFFYILKKGLRKIMDKYFQDQYTDSQFVIVSRKSKIKIPIHIRHDKKNPDELIGVIATTLHSEENPYDKYDEIQVLVEQSKKEKWYGTFNELSEVYGEDKCWFNHYIENGEYHRDFEYIDVDEG